MARLPITDLCTDDIKTILGYSIETPMTLEQLCLSDRVIPEGLDPVYCSDPTQVPSTPQQNLQWLRVSPYNISKFRNYGFDDGFDTMAIWAVEGRHNVNPIHTIVNDEYWVPVVNCQGTDKRCIVRDDLGYVWVGSESTHITGIALRGLYCYDGTSWFRYTTPNIAGTYVYALSADLVNKKLWIGTDNGFTVMNTSDRGYVTYRRGMSRVPDAKFPSNHVSCILHNDYDNTDWLGTPAGITHIRNISVLSQWFLIQTPILASNNITCFAHMNEERIVAGMWGGGIAILTYSGGVYYNADRNTGNSDITSDNVYSVAVDSDGIIWIGTDNGLNRFDYDNSEWTAYGLTEGLLSLNVYAVHADLRNNKWIGSDNGLCKIEDGSTEIRTWGRFSATNTAICAFLTTYSQDTYYRQITIGSQVWMRDNYRSNKRFMFPTGLQSKVYDFLESNRQYHGGLYSWYHTQASGFCPRGWKMPTFEDWEDLITELGGDAAAGDALKSLSDVPNDGWLSVLATVTNSSEFTAKGSGNNDSSVYSGIGRSGRFWTDDENEANPSEAVAVGMYNDLRGTYYESYYKNSVYLSVRLIQTVGLADPVALPATDVTFTTLTANWESMAEILGYKLDISTDPNFGTFLPGYEDLDVGDVTSWPVTDLEAGETYYYRIRVYTADNESDNSNVIETTMLIIYTACATYRPDFVSHSADNEMFLSVGLLTLDTGSLGYYAIDWREGSIFGTIVFTSGITADTGEVQAQHPFTNEIVFAGTLYPVIKYIFINGTKYTSEYEEGVRFSPDLISCIDPIIIDAIECETVYGTDTLYPYYLTYTNGVDLADNKSRALKYNICGPDMKFLAVEFNAYSVSDQVKFYYCTLLDSTGVLLDNWVHGNRGVGGVPLTYNLYPSNYPTNPRIGLFGLTGTTPLCFIVDIRDFTYVTGDYLRIEITGGIYEPENSNTNWYIKLKSLDALAELFISDEDLYKIADTPTMSYLTDPSCRYQVSYNTTDAGSHPGRTGVGVPDLFKYLWFWQTLLTNPSGYTFANPVKLGMSWKTTGTMYGLFANTGWSLRSNLDPGEQIALQKTGDDYIFTFSDVDDYNKMKSDMALLKANANYTIWLGLTDADSRYYSYIYIYFSVADSVGDTGTWYYFFFFTGDTITYDDVNKKITITCQVPVNNFPDPGDCNNVDTVVASSITNMTSTKNLPNFSVHTHVKPTGWFYFTWPGTITDFNTSHEFLYSWVIEDCFVDGLVDMEALGFIKGMVAGSSYPNAWYLPHYYDRVTLTDPSDHDHRLDNWRLERKIFLRTGNPADTAYEIVYEVAGGEEYFEGYYYVSEDGDDVTGDGSIDYPWATPDYAATQVTTEGDTIYITAGAYTVSSQWSLANGVNLIGVSRDTVTITMTYAGGSPCIKLESAGEWGNPAYGNQHISGITFDGDLTGLTGIGVIYRSSVDIHDCDFVDFVDHAAYYTGQPSSDWSRDNPYNENPATTYPYIPDINGWCSGNKFYGNNVTNCARWVSGDHHTGALCLGTQDEFEAYNNVIDSTGRNGYGIKFYDFGFNQNSRIHDNDIEVSFLSGSVHFEFAIEWWMGWGGDQFYNNRLRGALDFVNMWDGISAGYSAWVYDNEIGRDSVPTTLERGILLEGTCEYIYVWRNHIHHVARAVYVPRNNYTAIDRLFHIYFWDNLMVNLGQSLTNWQTWGFYWSDWSDEAEHEYIYIQNNTIVADPSITNPTMFGIQLPYVTKMSNIYVENNIIVGFDNCPIHASETRTIATDIYIRNNLCYGNGNSNDPLFDSDFIASATYTVSGAVKDDPHFVSTSNFHLQSGSHARGAGRDVDIDTDYDEVAWGVTPDIGAYKYV